MKRSISFILAAIVSFSCSIIDYENELRTFEYWTRNMAARFCIDTHYAFHDLIAADHALFGIGDKTGYQEIEKNVWLTSDRDTIRIDGKSLLDIGSTWTVINSGGYHPDIIREYTFTRVSDGWIGHMTETLSERNDIPNFSSSTDIMAHVINNSTTLHITGERTENDYTARFRTGKDGLSDLHGIFRVETYRMDTALDWGEISLTGDATDIYNLDVKTGKSGN